MAVRRRRLRVVLDTNVLVGAFLSRDPESPNLRVYRMWGERRLQLILSDEIQSEYLGVLARLGASTAHRQGLTRRLRTRSTVTFVRPPRALRLSRDPFDNAFLAAAVAGRAHFLVTNDGDLLQIPIEAIRAYRFRIMTPSDFLRAAPRFRR
ncbi:MAG: putative toxin-antitoxin system toxin component, PIN family [candidate division NC10 bacterium]|nr:putative toxin-antitoxin system toxin component, PIN family [candidate division NC10 bacterium]